MKTLSRIRIRTATEKARERFHDNAYTPTQSGAAQAHFDAWLRSREA